VLGGVMFVGLGGFLLLFMPEEGFTPTPPEERDSWRQMRDTLRQGVALVRVRPVLVGLLLIGVVYGAYSEGFDRLWTAFLLTEITLPQIGALQPVMWFGIIGAVTRLLGIGGTELARRRVNLTDRRSVTRALTLFYGTMALGTVVFALSGNLAVALAAFWLVATARTVAGPIFTAWFNQHVDSRVRATMLSMSAQADEIGQIAGGPVIGAIGTIFSLRIALALGGLILLPVLRLLHGQRIQVAPVVDSTPAD
jgi:DHA3 family tetracycline resistance protein-like MFS transporter